MNYSKYKSSYLDSFIDLSIHSLLYLSSLYGTWYYRNHCLSILIISLLGLMNMRTFMSLKLEISILKKFRRIYSQIFQNVSEVNKSATNQNAIQK